MYRRFTEHNDWEGETWHFYIPVEGNEDALDLLAELIEEDDSFELDESELDSDTVETLVEQTDSGYMDFHNALEGYLELPDNDSEALQALYKGGISDLMS